MDTLVAQYSRSAYDNEGYSEEEQYALAETMPSLSLKFDLPPIQAVRLAFPHD